MIVFMYEENNYVFIQEEEKAYKVKGTTCKKIMDELCVLCGHTYEGSRNAICQSLHITKQPPILVSFERTLILFPVVNGNKGYWWFNYAYISKVDKWKQDTILITYLKDKLVYLDTSYRSFIRQMQRCKMYLKMMDGCDIQVYLDGLYKIYGAGNEV